VRELTVAEHRTILAILAHPNATERERIRQSTLPSSTYNVVRRRVFDEGWLSDILIPNPGPCGFAGVEAILTRPSLSAREELLPRWTNDPECVLLWSGVHALFAVFFRWGPGPRPSLPDASAEEAPGLFRVFADRSSGTIPVYFDYSGLWARFGGQPRPPSYPLGLDVRSAPADPRALAAALGLLSPDPAAPPAPRWMNLLRLPRPRRRALERGVVQARTVLDVPRVPPFEHRRIGEVVLVQGRLRSGASAPRLLSVLTGECEVYPFFLAEAGGNLILAGMGQTSSNAPGRVLVPSARRPVMAAIAEHLDPADVLIEPTESIDERVAHRFPNRPPATSAGRPGRDLRGGKAR
jgi:hypothetical protein